MTKNEITDLFLEDYGLERPKKWSIKTYLICILIIVIGWIIMALQIMKAQKFKAEYARRQREYPKMYAEEIKKFIGDTSALKASGLKKTGLEEDQITTLKPIFFWGYEWDAKDSYYRIGSTAGDICSIATFTFLFFTEDQVVVYRLLKDFYHGTQKESTTEYFYEDITNIKTGEETKEINKTTSINYNSLTLIVPGDSYRMSVSSASDDISNSVQGMKTLLRNKKKGNRGGYDA